MTKKLHKLILQTVLRLKGFKYDEMTQHYHKYYYYADWGGIDPVPTAFIHLESFLKESILYLPKHMMFTIKYDKNHRRRNYPTMEEEILSLEEKLEFLKEQQQDMESFKKKYKIYDKED